MDETEVIEVVDHLESDNGSAALSARQGRILNEKILNQMSTTDIDAIFVI